MSVGIIAGNVASLNVVEVSWDIPSVAANTTAEASFTFNGVKVGDWVQVSKADLDAGLMFGSARVSAANTVTVQLVNATAAPIDAATETVRLLVARPERQVAATGLQT